MPISVIKEVRIIMKGINNEKINKNYVSRGTRCAYDGARY